MIDISNETKQKEGIKIAIWYKKDIVFCGRFMDVLHFKERN